MSVLLPRRVLLIDDHAMFRAGLKMVLTDSALDIVVEEAASIDEALSDVIEAPDVVLLDILLQGLNGLAGLSMLARQWPAARVLVLSSKDEAETVRTALENGAAGFLSKAESADTMLDAVRRALAGHRASSMAPATRTPATAQLTPRQVAVVNQLYQGKSNKLIARALGLSDNTVRRHVQDILALFDVSSRTEAVFAARRAGLFDRNEDV